MQNKEFSKIKGRIKLTLKDKFGNTKKLWNENKLGKFFRIYLGLDLKGIFFLGCWKNNLEFHNIITSVGKAGLASRCNGDGSEAIFNYLALGIGTTAANIADTTLVSEIIDSGLVRSVATCSRTTTNVTNDTAKLTKVWTVTGSKAITEVGALNASSVGVLLGRQVFSAVNVIATDNFQIDYLFVISV